MSSKPKLIPYIDVTHLIDATVLSSFVKENSTIFEYLEYLDIWDFDALHFVSSLYCQISTFPNETTFSIYKYHNLKFLLKEFY